MTFRWKPQTHFEVQVFECPACHADVFDYVQMIEINGGSEEAVRHRLFPMFGGARVRLNAEGIPAQLRELFNEAAAIEGISVRGAAALLRLSLQAALIQQGFAQRSLDEQIDAAVTGDKGWPAVLLQKLQIVRLLGNFGVHWILDDAGNVIEVELVELEAMFGAVEQLFRVVFVDPQADAADIARINVKLEKAGKPMRIGPAGSMVDSNGQPWQVRRRQP